MNTIEFPSAVAISGGSPSQLAGKSAPQNGTSFSSVFNSVQQGTNLDAIFQRASQTYGVSLNLLKAVAKAESDFDPTVVSTAGAQGIMQLMPGTAKSLGVSDPFDAEQNILGGAKYLSQLLRKYEGEETLAVPAYNAGTGNVKKYGGIPPFKETQKYVQKVMKLSGSELTAGTAPLAAQVNTADERYPLTAISEGVSPSTMGATTAESYLMLKLYQHQALQALFTDTEQLQSPMASLFSDSMLSQDSSANLFSNPTEEALTKLF